MSIYGGGAAAAETKEAAGQPTTNPNLIRERCVPGRPPSTRSSAIPQNQLQRCACRAFTVAQCKVTNAEDRRLYARPTSVQEAETAWRNRRVP
ncbi:hypothetical protein ANO14919_099240 [Xylariales sp. No.14919]|nr:hypothetical protein ANO14919_099240 [Xylariales sp. No.14919]